MNAVAIITGASRGLGAALARELARRGARLVLTARSAEPLARLTEELRSRTQVVARAGDVSDDAHMDALLADAQKAFGHVTVIVNNASTLGGVPMPALAELPQSAFRELMEVNVRAPLRIVQRVLPAMRDRGSGTIVNITSDAGVNAYAGWGGYGASKAALEHLSRVMAAELEGSGVRVLLIDPGSMDTRMHRDAEPDADFAAMATPEAIASIVADLIENGASSFERVEAQSVGVRI